MDSVSQRIVYLTVESMPSFRDNKFELMKYFSELIEEARLNKLHRSLKLVFIIESNGSISNPRIYDKSESDYVKIDHLAIKMLHRMPRWNPGLCDREPVPVLFHLPIYY
jgi:hypothetical protein